MARKELKCTNEQLETWEQQAKRDGYKSVSQWIRDTLDAACDNQPIKTLPGWGDHNRVYND